MRATAVMTVGTTLSRLTGFVRIAIMAWAIGGAESKLPDTYNLANSLPNIVYQLVLGEILATVFVPVFVEYIKTKQSEESWQLASTIHNAAFLLSFAFSAITVIAAPWIIKIYTFHLSNPAVRAQMESTGTFFMRIFMPQMIFYATGAVLSGLLTARRKFAPPMFAPILNNVIVSGTFIIFHYAHGHRPINLESLRLGEKWLLAGGTTLGVIAFTWILWPYVHKLPGKFQWRALNFRHPAIRHVGTLAKWSLGYVLVNQIGLWVATVLANGTTGGISAYQSAFILFQLPYGIFAVSIMTALIPSMSEHYIRNDNASFVHDLSTGLRSTALIVFPATAGFIALSRPINRMLLEHGVFKAHSTTLFSNTFLMMAVGLTFYAAFQQIMRAFYARQDTRTPFIVNVVSTIVNIVADIVLYRVMGVPGLSLGFALSFVVATIHGGYLLRIRLGSLDGRKLLSSHSKITIAAAATGVAAWLSAKGLQRALNLHSLSGQILQVTGAIVAGLILYVALAAVLHIEEIRPVMRILSTRFVRGKENSNVSDD
ncbi:MAG: murein biosynthesis integral membrane protein MurJ [Actinomycetota bacterium]